MAALRRPFGATPRAPAAPICACVEVAGDSNQEVSVDGGSEWMSSHWIDRESCCGRGADVPLEKAVVIGMRDEERRKKLKR